MYEVEEKKMLFLHSCMIANTKTFSLQVRNVKGQCIFRVISTNINSNSVHLYIRIWNWCFCWYFIRKKQKQNWNETWNHKVRLKRNDSVCVQRINGWFEKKITTSCEVSKLTVYLCYNHFNCFWINPRVKLFYSFRPIFLCKMVLKLYKFVKKKDDLIISNLEKVIFQRK